MYDMSNYINILKITKSYIYIIQRSLYGYDKFGNGLRSNPLFLATIYSRLLR